jgi:phage-related protein
MANTIVVDILADTRSLVAGVKETNAQLGGLGKSVSGIKTAFSGLAAAFGFQIGIGFLKDAVKGAAEDQAAFKRLADAFGTDIEGITKKVNEISSTFKVDDGAIATYFVQLKSAFSANFDKFVPTVVEASATLALLTGKPLDEVISLWAKTLRDGKITAQEVQKLGIDLTSEQEKKFNSLKTTAERLQFLLDIINSPENRKKALDNLTPYEKFNYYMEKLRDTIGGSILPYLEKFFNWYDKLSPKQQELIDKVIAFTIGIAALAAALAPVVIVGESFVKLFLALREAIIGSQIAAALFNGTLLANPIVWIVALVIGLIAVIVLTVKHWKEITQVVGEVWEKIKGFGAYIGGALSTAFSGLVSAITGVVSSIRNAVSNIWNAISSTVSGWAGNLLNLGKNIIQGLINGITSSLTNVVSAVKNVGNSILNTIKGIFHIGSPSKVFADYGKYMMQGLAQGITKNSVLATRAIGGLSLQPDLAFAGTGSQYGAVNNYVTVNAGLGTDPYELGRVVKAALVKYEGVNGR